MPDLIRSLEGQDIGFLVILANLWDVEPPSEDTQATRSSLMRSITDLDVFQKQYASLTEQAKAALHEIQKHHGRMVWNQFTRVFGEVRDYGPSWRDREQPHLNPISTSEYLWYRGLICRAFMKQGPVPQEFVYIPDDVLTLIPQHSRKPYRKENISDQNDREARGSAPYHTRLLDDLCTALAAMRCNLPPYQNQHLLIRPPYSTFLGEIMRVTGQVNQEGELQPERARQLLEAQRENAFLEVFQTWRESPDIYELAIVPAIRLEGEWSYDARLAREAALKLVIDLHSEDWISLFDFCAKAKQAQPDFLRPDANYDTWLVRNRSTGEYLQGFSHWDDVEGAYLRFVLLGPLFWMGVVETRRDDTPGSQIFFRLTELGQDLLHNAPPPAFPSELGKITIMKTTMLSVPAASPRWVRYMIARMCEWVGRQSDLYLYRITPEGLANARKQGLFPSHLLKLLQRFCSSPPRPSLTRSLQRWEEHGTEASVETAEVLRVGSPIMLSKLRESQAARFLGEPLGTTAIILKPGSRDMVLRSLTELGYLAEVKKDETHTRTNDHQTSDSE
jgi:hypothetical protein